MSEEPVGPHEASTERFEADQIEAAPKLPRKSVRPRILIIVAVMLVVVVIVSIALINPLLSGKEVRGMAYDLLLDENDLPDGWSVMMTIGVNRSGPLEYNGREYQVSSNANAFWNGSSESGNITVFCIIYVMDNPDAAHALFIRMTGSGGEPLWDDIGDESGIWSSGNSYYITSVGMLREANVVVSIQANYYATDGYPLDPHFNDLFRSVLEKQCDKIKAAEKGPFDF